MIFAGGGGGAAKVAAVGQASLPPSSPLALNSQSVLSLLPSSPVRHTHSLPLNGEGR